jgi:aminoglycoside phosphotransferase (APT) family kinase protein
VAQAFAGLPFRYVLLMGQPGRKLASGRDADIFEYGPDLVLRRSRQGRSVAHEARVMEYLHGSGYPVPAIHDVSDDGTELVMERIDGPTMVDYLSRRPWQIRHLGRTLAELHRRLHEIPPPDFLGPAAFGQGESLVHMDLHPLNVLIGPHGPVVIDWTNAGRGDPLVDVTLAYLLIASGTIPGGRLEQKILGWGRTQLIRGFLGGRDRSALRPRILEVAERKAADPNLSSDEIQAMWKIAREVARER